MWLLYVQLLGAQNRCGFVCAVVIIRLNCQLMTKLETKQIWQAQVCDGIITNNEAGNCWYIIQSAKSSTLKLDNFEVLLRKSIKGP